VLPDGPGRAAVLLHQRSGGCHRRQAGARSRGVLVKDEAGAVLSCVGVSGDTSDNDELTAVAGITSASLVPQPD